MAGIMTSEADTLLRRSACTRAVLALLRWSELSAPQLAWLLAGRHASGTVRHAVLELRRLGHVIEAGRMSKYPSRAKCWMVKR